MTSALALLACGLLLLYVGGESLVSGAVRLAGRTRLSPLAVGMTVVAFGTSGPELLVSLDAALAGLDGIAVGNVVGSNLCNVGLILGVAALIRPLPAGPRLGRLDLPLLLGVSLLLPPLLADGRLSRPEGGLLAAGLIAWTAFELRRMPRDADAEPTAPSAPAWLEVLRLALALAALALGAHLFVRGAVHLASDLGVGEAAIGLTVVAVGTSLPELATSLLAARRRETDLAIGNVVGSNVFNVLGILGVTALVRPLGRGGVDGADLALGVVAPALLWGLVAWRGALGRPEGGLLLLGWIVYVGWRLHA